MLSMCWVMWVMLMLDSFVSVCCISCCDMFMCSVLVSSLLNISCLLNVRFCYVFIIVVWWIGLVWLVIGSRCCLI